MAMKILLKFMREEVIKFHTQKKITFSKKVIMVLTPLEFSGCQNSQEILIQKSSMEAG